jgi:hypothetical protein
MADAAAEQTKKIMDGLGEGMPMWQRALRGGANSLKTLGTESINAATSLAAAGDAAESMSGVMDAGNKMIAGSFGQIPVIGGALAGSASLLTDAFKALMNILMSGYNDFASLSEAGAAGTASLEELKDSAREAGIPLFAFGKYTDLIRENASSLAMMGGTVGEARIQFDGLLKDVHHVKGAYTKQLLVMGMNQEEILKFAGGWTKILSRTGRAQNMTSAQMAESTFKAAKEMDVLARLTGIQKDKLLEEQNKAYSHSRFRMAIREAENSGDKDLMRKGERAAKMYALAEKSPALQKAIADTFTGVITTGESLGYQILTSGGLREAVFADSSKSAHDQMQALALSMGSGLDKFASVEAKIGYLSKELGIDAAEAADFVRVWEGANIAKAEGEVKERLEDKGKTLHNIIDAIESMQLAREEVDKQIIALLSDGSKLFADGAKYIEEGAKKFGDILNNIKAGWDNFSKTYIGRKLFGDLTDEDKLATAMIDEKGVLSGGYTQKAKHALVMEQMGLDPNMNIMKLGARTGEYQEKMAGMKLRGSSKDQLDNINKKAMDIKRKQMLDQAGHRVIGGDLTRSNLQEYLRDKFIQVGKSPELMDTELDPVTKMEIIEKMGLDAKEQNKLLEDIRRLMTDQVLITAGQ